MTIDSISVKQVGDDTELIENEDFDSWSEDWSVD